PQTARFVEFNTAAHQQLGYSREEFAQLTIRDVEVMEADSENLARLTESNQTGSVDFETLHHTRQGEIRNIHVTSRLVIVQGQAVHQCVFRDITERKRAEDELRLASERLKESEARYRSLFEVESDAIIVVDWETGGFVNANPSALRLYGYHWEEFLRLTQDDVTAEPDQTRQATATEHALVALRWHRKKDGTLFPVEISSAFFESLGRKLQVVAIRDITERQQVEAALSQKTSELTERFKELECLYAMSRLVAASDKSMEEIFKEAVYLIPPGCYYPRIACARIAIGEEQFMTDNFRQTPWRLAADLVASGKKLGSVEVCYLEERPARDEGPFLKEERALIDNLARKISATVERRQAKMVLQQSEVKLRAMTERQTLAARAGGVGIWDYDVVNNRLVWDDQMFALYGITRDQFSGAYEAWLAGLHPEDRQRGSEEVGMALRGEKEFNTEFRVLWPDGSIHHLRARATVYRDASGQSVRILGTNWDITYAKQVAEQLQQTNAELTAKERALEAEVEVRRAAEQRVRDLNDQLALRVTELGAVNAELESFSYTVSHDLRAPLRQIVGFAHSLQKAAGDRLDPRAAEYIPLLQGSATRMGQLIDAMIEFSGLGRTTVHFGPVQLQSLAEQACQVLQPAIAGRIVHWKIGPLP
ncbi:MAG: PAS domain S-box protein, partial [Verrucomicrobiota bacterium]